MKKVRKKEFKKSDNTITEVFKCAAISFALFVILLLIYCSLLVYTELSESTMIPVFFVISIISALIGSMICTLKIKKNGLLIGGIVGLITFLETYILSGLIYLKLFLNTTSITMIISMIVTGMIGGVIGINIEKDTKYRI